ncbi:MAG: hypothetical protein Q9202_003948 [Teloschistes flavicans]
MKIKELYFYPIKSLRGIPISSALLTPQGIVHDRRFMLFKVNPLTDHSSESNGKAADRLQRMTVTFFPQLGLFTQDLLRSENGSQNLRVTCHEASETDRTRRSQSIVIPLIPSTEELQGIDVSLHGSPTRAFVMHEWVCKWFSECFGWDTLLVYMPEGTTRPVLGNLLPSKVATSDDRSAVANGTADGWFSTFTNYFPGHPTSATHGQKEEEEGITFSDCAPYLVVTEESLKDVSSRLPNGGKADITKFRPNLVLEGAGEAYEEDFWGAISILPTDRNASFSSRTEDARSVKDHQETLDISLTQNCLRCQSLDIDYSTGTFFKSDEGTVLKKMMRDRRVDMGNKWSPVFGRYGFIDGRDNCQVNVGDEVIIRKRNEKRTKFCRFPQEEATNLRS